MEAGFLGGSGCSEFAVCLTRKEEPMKIVVVACLIFGMGKRRPREVSDLIKLAEVIRDCGPAWVLLDLHRTSCQDFSR